MAKDEGETLVRASELTDAYRENASLREDIDELRASLAEVTRERDEARRMLTAHNCVCDDPPRCPVFDERDDARRVAKRLAQVLAANGFRWDGTIALDVWIDTALAYEVEP